MKIVVYDDYGLTLGQKDITDFVFVAKPGDKFVNSQHISIPMSSKGRPWRATLGKRDITEFVMPYVGGTVTKKDIIVIPTGKLEIALPEHLVDVEYKKVEDGDR